MKISWKIELLYTMMKVIGTIMCLIGIFALVLGGRWIWFVAGMVLVVAEIYLDDRLYRCPHCGHYLKERNHRGIPSDHVFTNCPGCGWRVIIEK